MTFNFYLQKVLSKISLRFRMLQLKQITPAALLLETVLYHIFPSHTGLPHMLTYFR